MDTKWRKITLQMMLAYTYDEKLKFKILNKLRND